MYVTVPEISSPPGVVVQPHTMTAAERTSRIDTKDTALTTLRFIQCSGRHCIKNVPCRSVPVTSRFTAHEQKSFMYDKRNHSVSDDNTGEIREKDSGCQAHFLFGTPVIAPGQKLRPGLFMLMPGSPFMLIRCPYNKAMTPL